MTINCSGLLVDFNTPKIMGILNLTPDSFYDGGRYKNTRGILNHVEKMLKEGATFIDLGAYSSRPGAENVSVEEEKKRLFPILKLLFKEFDTDILISVDTFRAEVALESIEYGACMINDISAGAVEPQIMEVVAKFKIPYVMMHRRGTAQNMMQFTNYKNLMVDIISYFTKRMEIARQKGITDIIIDPGFGFSKNVNQNFELLHQLKLLNILNAPILCGISRKSMIYKTLDCLPKDALNGTTALHAIALYNGCHILRVHDVKECAESVKLINVLLKKI